MKNNSKTMLQCKIIIWFVRYYIDFALANDKDEKI